MRARLKQPEKQAIYRKRKWVAEQVFGQIKGGLGFRELTMRGQDLARAQWLFACAVHNVMKAVRHISSLKKEGLDSGNELVRRTFHPLWAQTWLLLVSEHYRVPRPAS